MSGTSSTQPAPTEAAPLTPEQRKAYAEIGAALAVGQFYYPPGAPDMTLSGLQRRLAAMRAAVRYRNPQTGRKHYCHLGEYRARWAAGMRELRASIKEQPK